MITLAGPLIVKQFSRRRFVVGCECDGEFIPACVDIHGKPAASGIPLSYDSHEKAEAVRDFMQSAIDKINGKGEPNEQS